MRTRDEARAALAEALGLSKDTTEERLTNLTKREQLLLVAVEEMHPTLAAEADHYWILWGQREDEVRDE